MIWVEYHGQEIHLEDDMVDGSYKLSIMKKMVPLPQSQSMHLLKVSVLLIRVPNIMILSAQCRLLSKHNFCNSQDQ